jgi:carboxyl-terminal processing protease
VQEVIPLDSRGGELKLTVAYYYLPSGRLVHRKKDATDWGVQPQISVPLDNTAEAKAFVDMNERDRFLRPVKVTTQPTTGTASTTPTTQPQLDAQLQRAVDTMIALAVLEEGRTGGKPYEVPALPATTAPSTAPAAAPPAE